VTDGRTGKATDGSTAVTGDISAAVLDPSLAGAKTTAPETARAERGDYVVIDQ